MNYYFKRIVLEFSTVIFMKKIYFRTLDLGLISIFFLGFKMLHFQSSSFEFSFNLVFSFYNVTILLLRFEFYFNLIFMFQDLHF